MNKFANKKLIIFATIAVLLVCFAIILLSIVMQNGINSNQFIVKGSVQNSLTSLGFSPTKFEINSQSIQTDAQGNFETSLSAGTYTIYIESTGYINYEENLVLNSNIENLKILVLPENLATFKGKLVSDSGHSFLNDTLNISNVPIEIQNDGTFQGAITEGTYTLVFFSESYKDINTNISLNRGENNLSDIILVAAGDITGELKSYLREENLTNLSIIAENTDESQIEIDYQNNKFRIKDLDPLAIYSILFRSPGYFEREYRITIKQGSNQIFNLKFVEDITALYPKQPTNTRDKPNLFVSNIDGENEVQISSGNFTNIVSRYLKSSENKIYFQVADNNSIRDYNRQNIGLIYTFDLKTKETKLVTTNTSSLNKIFPNFEANKMIQYNEDARTKQYSIYISDLSGDNKQEIYSGSNEIVNFFVSKDGKSVIFSLKVDTQINVYRYSLASDFYNEIFRGNEIRIFDITSDASKVLYYRKNTTSGFLELAEFTIDQNNTVIIEENFRGEFYQYLAGNNSIVIYSIFTDGRNNIFYYNSKDNSKTRLLALPSDLDIAHLYQESGIIYYLTNKGLYAVDFAKPFASKLVSNQVVQYLN